MAVAATPGRGEGRAKARARADATACGVRGAVTRAVRRMTGAATRNAPPVPLGCHILKRPRFFIADSANAGRGVARSAGRARVGAAGTPRADAHGPSRGTTRPSDVGRGNARDRLAAREWSLFCLDCPLAQIRSGDEKSAGVVPENRPVSSNSPAPSGQSGARGEERTRRRCAPVRSPR